MARILGVEVSKQSIILSQIHTAIEWAGGVGWIALSINGHPFEGAIVWLVTLEIEHVFALAAGKIA